MGTVYPRGERLWFALVNEIGKRIWRAAKLPDGTPLRVGDETRAERVLALIEKQIAASSKVIAAGGKPSGPVTVAAYAKWWIAERRKRGVRSADDDEDRLAHALPALGAMLMYRVERVHVRDMVRDLVAARKLAPRTILHVYGVLRVMFGDALTEGVVSISPCTLSSRRRELPKKRDKTPGWRKLARFERREVEQLIGDARIAEDRRMLYALIFLGGPRINEMTPRRFSDYDPTVRPLGALQVNTSLERRTRVEGPVKTEFPRTIPVHPVLARLLAQWKLTGWAKYQGRPPKADDIIVPNVPARGKSHKAGASPFLSSNRVWVWLQRDLETLGLRPRRVHDSRRTFISLVRGDGGQKDLVHWITHGPTADDIDDNYMSPDWSALCEQVSKLKIRPVERKVLALRSEGGRR